MVLKIIKLFNNIIVKIIIDMFENIIEILNLIYEKRNIIIF